MFFFTFENNFVILYRLKHVIFIIKIQTENTLRKRTALYYSIAYCVYYTILYKVNNIDTISERLCLVVYYIISRLSGKILIIRSLYYKI